jgi:hypothetical protein
MRHTVYGHLQKWWCAEPEGPVMVCLRICVCIVAMLRTTVAAGETAIEQGYNYMYNLQFDNAHRSIAQYETSHPDDPLGLVSDAAAYLFSEFDRLHILQSEFFVNDTYILNSSKQHPDPSVKARFDEDLSKAQRLAGFQMKKPTEQSNAIFAETLRLGLRADYLSLIEKRNFAALAEIKKARELAQQLLSGYPKCYDAYLAIGVENYLLSLKPAPIRWALRMSGAETDKQNGLEKLRLTAEHGHYLMPYARLLLAVAALRDGDRNKAPELLGWLASRYPHNNLYHEELAKLH